MPFPWPWPKKEQEDGDQRPVLLLDPGYRHSTQVATRARPHRVPADACCWCDAPRDGHGTRYTWLTGYHTWESDSRIRKPIKRT